MVCVMSRGVCYVTWCDVMSRGVCYVTWCDVMSRGVTSCHVV